MRRALSVTGTVVEASAVVGRRWHGASLHEVVLDLDSGSSARVEAAMAEMVPDKDGMSPFADGRLVAQAWTKVRVEGAVDDDALRGIRVDVRIELEAFTYGAWSGLSAALVAVVAGADRRHAA